MTDNDPFAYLGIPYGSSAEEVRTAYRTLVKKCHPDLFSDPGERRAAQEETVRLNLAYEEALRQAGHKTVGFNMIPAEEAKHFAKRLLEQNNPESAMRQLNRAESKDADWFALRGDIEMKIKQYEAAHDSYREAIRRDPDNRIYREGALQAALAMKKNRSVADKLFGWIKK